MEEEDDENKEDNEDEEEDVKDKEDDEEKNEREEFDHNPEEMLEDCLEELGKENVRGWRERVLRRQVKG